ncbi:hypothetical protein CC1G_13753 [Coprinopsis cinerea okayama7|uniref:Uncharacterized protein n=1 Tax=Coprinopsis cinerea (strain Okayama-7 / 130 / ATCC MYA-4618 / FGSC 9003) TaxID=240176 RepID=D6RK81_COPC7|nr:hypothetical protein CC1G_13753 [Coprinopsis cinerea okayama7\|eukprot:XP_002912221.1 hypothetical protein CC1G_13753 [Coprinopsis cinerea okayama7\
MRDVTGPSGALPQPAVRGASDIRHGTYIRWHHAACSNYVGVPGKYQARHFARVGRFRCRSTKGIRRKEEVVQLDWTKLKVTKACKATKMWKKNRGTERHPKV